MLPITIVPMATVSVFLLMVAVPLAHVFLDLVAALFAALVLLLALTLLSIQTLPTFNQPPLFRFLLTFFLLPFRLTWSNQNSKYQKLTTLFPVQLPMHLRLVFPLVPERRRLVTILLVLQVKFGFMTLLVFLVSIIGESMYLGLPLSPTVVLAILTPTTLGLNK